MKKLLSIAVSAAILASALPAPGVAGSGAIDRACRQANRTAASPQLCRCIQRVANHSLTRSERRKVAKWFSDPHRAQEVRQSAHRSDEILWERYKSFGERAARICS